MRPALSDPPDKKPTDPSAPPTDTHASLQAIDKREPRNFVVLALYQVLMRMGWIFKTESIIMPAVMDSIGGAGWLRGCLPLLNRFGQSIPPLLMARRIKIMQRKKRALAACTLLMASAFLTLSGIWFATGGPRTWWMPIVFLVFYAMFFMSTGVNQLSFGTLQGKLIQTTRRGRLLMAANVCGAISAITCAWFLLPLWLRLDGNSFEYVFLFAGACFTASAMSSLLLAEPPDDYHQPASPLAEIFAGAGRTLREDANFRRLAFVAALFGCSIMLFPHYQSLGRHGRPSSLDILIWWVVMQNLGTALFSMPAGPLADWRGNRLVLRLVLLGIFSAPVLALLLSRAGTTGDALYFLVFILVGLTPVTIKTLNNYTLEICEAEDHTRYLSTLSLCMATPPILLSPIVGLLIDLLGFGVVFAVISAIVFVGWLLTFGLAEPRHHLIEPAEAVQITPDQ